MNAPIATGFTFIKTHRVLETCLMASSTGESLKTLTAFILTASSIAASASPSVSCGSLLNSSVYSETPVSWTESFELNRRGTMSGHQVAYFFESLLYTYRGRFENSRIQTSLSEGLLIEQKGYFNWIQQKTFLYMEKHRYSAKFSDSGSGVLSIWFNQRIVSLVFEDGVFVQLKFDSRTGIRQILRNVRRGTLFRKGLPNDISISSPFPNMRFVTAQVFSRGELISFKLVTETTYKKNFSSAFHVNPTPPSYSSLARILPEEMAVAEIGGTSGLSWGLAVKRHGSIPSGEFSFGPFRAEVSKTYEKDITHFSYSARVDDRVDRYWEQFLDTMATNGYDLIWLAELTSERPVLVLQTAERVLESTDGALILYRDFAILQRGGRTMTFFKYSVGPYSYDPQLDLEMDSVMVGGLSYGSVHYARALRGNAWVSFRLNSHNEVELIGLTMVN